MPLRLDDKDLKILSVLQKEGRISKLALAERVHLSPTPCWERLRRLEREGVIRSYHADIALERIRPFTQILVEVTLKRHQFDDFARFEKRMCEIGRVVDCYAVGGGVDYLLRVAAHDIDDYQRFMDELLQSDLGMDRYFTYIVTRTVKGGGHVPLTALEPSGKGSSRS